MDEGSGIFPVPQIHFADVTTPSIPDADKQGGCKVPTMVLSEARGLLLFLVVRGGIWLTQRLGAAAHDSPNAVMDTHPRTRAPEEPTSHDQK
jgi:hypothetical protein